MAEQLTSGDASKIAAALEQRWVERTLAADVEGMVDLFSKTAIFLGSLPTIFQGPDGVRRYMTTVNLGATRAVTFEDRHVQVLSPDIFTSLNHVVFDAEVGGNLLSVRCAFSWTVVRENGDWKIVQQHASVRPPT